MAPFILGERVGAHRIGAVLIGFAGVVLLINPFSEADSSPLWGIGFAFGIATPFFGALMFIFLRKLGQTEAPISTTLWYNMTGTIIFFVIAFTDGPLIPQNLTEKNLKKDNFIVISHQKLPSNDGCIALGQAIVANAIIDNLKSQT